MPTLSVPMTRFEECLPFILKWEGGYVNHPSDRGGATNKGITQRNYDSWRIKQGLSVRTVKDITDDEVHSIYLTEYWARAGCPTLPEPVDLVVFDCAVNSGVSRAVKWLQKALGLNQDGLFGAKTNAAVLACNPLETALEILVIREDFLSDVVDANPSQIVFLKGWHSRLDSLKTEITKEPA